ncbi:hypothetical protein B9Z19DRAFT_1122829 [Tuber borchii]|uniref:Uncharacterized protein n=1 Tax=Tuber borchii TaxID=42251 RepID=A0A2T6ZZN4_TUBBO|nr:hypothetical protein B9Z19DRAFT_1122829 [Tuber borchii]
MNLLIYLLPLTNEAAIEAREQIMRACQRIISLVAAPMETVMGMTLWFHETTTIKLAYEMKLEHSVPLNGSPITLAELAAKTEASEDTIS